MRVSLSKLPVDKDWESFRFVTSRGCKRILPHNYSFCLHCWFTLRSMLLMEQGQGTSLGVTAPRDYYAWNYRELATLLALSEVLAEDGFMRRLIIRSMSKGPTQELS